ncbi:hypothetical protein [Clostridium sp.]|uniref:hypothetical protein n=1 Tax=Clostridium sp. TaxID=1506 RepID=UPI003F3FB5B2
MLLQRCEVYTVREFLNKEAIEEMNKFDRMLGHLKRNKKKYMALVTIIALTMDLSCINSFANGYEAIDRAGMEILTLVRKVGYWLCIILCAKDVIKKSMKGHMDSLGTIVTMYGITFGTLYFLPWLFDLIQQIF